jgi:DNA primase
LAERTRRGTVESMMQEVGLALAVQYHQALPQRIEAYLKARGIPETLIDRHLLGWNGRQITIPILDRDEKLLYLKLAKDPADGGPGPKMLMPAGTSATLYGWEHLRMKPKQIVICEGEFDRLVLEAHGFAAVTSTAGAGVFRQEWADELKSIPEVFICFDRDEVGRIGAVRVGRMIPQARLVELPEQVGDGGDVTDFFVHLGRSRQAFERLLEGARPAPEPEAPPHPRVVPAESEPRDDGDSEVARLKAAAHIEDVVGQYILLRRNGEKYVAHCPFHDDRNPSFVLYPATETFYCFGCQARGDVLSFLMRIEGIDFPEALRVLRRFTSHP